jgi:hypothetical protein
MTRTISTTFIATALAVATLGLAGTAQANAPEQGVAIGEPPPAQLPLRPQADPDPGPVGEHLKPGGGAGEKMGEAGENVGKAIGEKVGQAPARSWAPRPAKRWAPRPERRWAPRSAKRWSRHPAKGTTPHRPASTPRKSHNRFKRHCITKKAKPSHRHKRFCELYRKHHGATGTARPAPAGTPKAPGSAGIPTGSGSTRPATATGDSTPTGSTRPATATGDSTPTSDPTATGSTLPATATGDSTPTSDRTATGSTRPATATGSEQPAAQAEQPLGGRLPFTGLAIWQVAVVGAALLGGGLGARRLLAG